MENEILSKEELDSICGGSVTGSYVGGCISAGLIALLKAIWPNTRDYNPAITDEQAIWNGFVNLANAQYSDTGMVESYKNVLRVWGLSDEQISAGLSSCIASCEKTVAKINKFVPMTLEFYLGTGRALIK